MSGREMVADLLRFLLSIAVLTGLALGPTLFPEVTMAVGMLVVVGVLGFLFWVPVLRAMGLDE